MAAQFCEYIKKLWIIYFPQVNCMPCELYLDEAIIKSVDDEI